MPVEASVSGVIGSENPAPIDGRLKIVRDRYLKAMDYLKSVDDTPGANSRSKLATYILKQESWSKAVKEYSEAQDSAITAVKPGPTATTGEVKAAREAYMQWIQEYGRDVGFALLSVSSRTDKLLKSSNMQFKPNIWTGLCMATNSWSVAKF